MFRTADRKGSQSVNPEEPIVFAVDDDASMREALSRSPFAGWEASVSLGEQNRLAFSSGIYAPPSSLYLWWECASCTTELRRRKMLNYALGNAAMQVAKITGTGGRAISRLIKMALDTASSSADSASKRSL